jgi:hypothetical protein
MPEFRQVCDLHQGFNFVQDMQSAIGYITALNVGGTAFAADFTTLTDPLNPSNAVAAVAVLGDVQWNVAPSEPVYFSGQISGANRQAVRTVLFTDLTNLKVTFQFDVYEYDPVAAKYFKSFTSAGTTMNGLLEKNGANLNIKADNLPASEVTSPQNYTFNIGIKPQPSKQSMTVSTADQKNQVKTWGIAG